MKNNEDRSLTKISANYTNTNADICILQSPCDLGVQRNFGRIGARFAPKAIEFQFKNLINHQSNIKFQNYSVTETCQNPDQFSSIQANQIEQISLALNHNNYSKIIHLGGGHDHIYCLLKALEKNGLKKIIVFNIDAHADTRIDEDKHSGTPFRQFDQETKIDFNLIQLGLHQWANSPSTLSPLKNYEKKIFDEEFYKMDTNALENLFKSYLETDAYFILSLDADALDSSIMESVSAVNAWGLKIDKMHEILKIFNKVFQNHHSVFGIYEYNPIFDNHNCKGSRTLACLMYNYIFS